MLDLLKEMRPFLTIRALRGPMTLFSQFTRGNLLNTFIYTVKMTIFLTYRVDWQAW